MAEVYLARSSGLQGFARHVVVKRIRSEFVRDPRFVRMFLDEARLAATLHHHHLVQVYDVGQDGGEYFFAMEYVHGEDLRRILGVSSKRRDRVRLEYALAIVQAAAAGLDYAHNQCGPDGSPLGLVHRDVSPSNILVGYDGSVKLVDFGIAKATSRPGETQVGTLKGKISYLSPEQLRGAAVDRRSDVFSLGVVLFELSTTTRLFRGANQFEIMHRVMTGDVPPPTAVVPGYPPELERIVLQALSVDPDARQQTAAELVAQLDALAQRERLGVSPTALGWWITETFGKRPEPWAATRSAPVNTEEAWTLLDGGVPSAADAMPTLEPSLLEPPLVTIAPSPSAPPRPSLSLIGAPSSPGPAAAAPMAVTPMPFAGFAASDATLMSGSDELPPPGPRSRSATLDTDLRRRKRSRWSGQAALLVALVVTGLVLVAGALFLRQRAPAPAAPAPAASPR